jgi:hypothetical protein
MLLVSVGTAAIPKSFGSTSTTSERVQALVDLLDVPMVARAAGVSLTAVRKWIEGTEPRADAAMAIDDLRSVVVVLLEAGFEPARIHSWLGSRDREWLDENRPIDCIRRKPMSVLSAANDAVNMHRFGAQSAAHAGERG